MEAPHLDYLAYLVFIDTFVLLIMCVLISQNQMLERRRKIKFIVTFMLIIVLSILEISCWLVNGKPGICKALNYILNYIGFVLAPALPLCFGLCIADIPKRNQIIIFFFMLTYAITILILIIFGKFFYLDADNFYHRGDAYFVFVIVYSITEVFLFITMFYVSAHYDLKNKIVIYLLFALFISSGVVQLLLPSIYVVQLTNTLLAIVSYAFFNQLWQQKDGLTSLFTQHCYLKKLNTISKNCTIMMMDIDDFKGINDKYGHKIGDECLAIIAKNMNQVFGKFGNCYRIGGDEFSVILNEGANPAKLTNLFEERLKLERKKYPWLPHVSTGWSEYSKGDNVLDAKDEADMKMYYYKEYRKKDSDYYKK